MENRFFFAKTKKVGDKAVYRHQMIIFVFKGKEKQWHEGKKTGYTQCK